MGTQSASYKAQGATTSVETTAGIKQGCKLSPTLLSFLTGQLFRSLIQIVEIWSGSSAAFSHRTCGRPHAPSHHTLGAGPQSHTQADHFPPGRGQGTQAGGEPEQMRHHGQASWSRGTEHHQQTLVLGNLCEGRESQRMAPRPQQDLSRVPVGSLQ